MLLKYFSLLIEKKGRDSEGKTNHSFEKRCKSLIWKGLDKLIVLLNSTRYLCITGRVIIWFSSISSIELDIGH